MAYVETKVTKGWKLDPELFARLLRWLDEDRDRAGPEYVKTQKRLCEFFAARGCPEHLSEHLADEVLNRVARRLAEGAVSGETPLAYIFGVARLVALEYHRNPERKNTPLDESDLERSVAENFPPPERDDPHHKCLDRCLEKLSPEKRDLILGYYRADDPALKRPGLLKRARIELRERFGMSERAMNAKTGRIRTQLKNCVNQCLERARQNI
jgi:DNA-directed RNA polymerase specialized sigma24 family protein